MSKINLKRRELIKSSMGFLLLGCTALCSACSLKSAKIDSKKCMGCRICISACPYGAISYSNNKVKIDRFKCEACGKCVSECSFDAITL